MRCIFIVLFSIVASSSAYLSSTTSRPAAVSIRNEARLAKLPVRAFVPALSRLATQRNGERRGFFPHLPALGAAKEHEAGPAVKKSETAATDDGDDIALRSKYLEWCEKFGKDSSDDERYTAFADTYCKIQASRKRRNDGDNHVFGYYADATWEEYSEVNNVAKDALSQMTVDELKRECRRRDLYVKGKKSDLVERVQAALLAEEVREYAVEEEDRSTMANENRWSKKEEQLSSVAEEEIALETSEPKSRRIEDESKAGKEATLLAAHVNAAESANAEEGKNAVDRSELLDGEDAEAKVAESAPSQRFVTKRKRTRRDGMKEEGRGAAEIGEGLYLDSDPETTTAVTPDKREAEDIDLLAEIGELASILLERAWQNRRRIAAEKEGWTKKAADDEAVNTEIKKDERVADLADEAPGRHLVEEEERSLLDVIAEREEKVNEQEQMTSLQKAGKDRDLLSGIGELPWLLRKGAWPNQDNTGQNATNPEADEKPGANEEEDALPTIEPDVVRRSGESEKAANKTVAETARLVREEREARMKDESLAREAERKARRAGQEEKGRLLREKLETEAIEAARAAAEEQLALKNKVQALEEEARRKLAEVKAARRAAEQKSKEHEVRAKMSPQPTATTARRGKSSEQENNTSDGKDASEDTELVGGTYFEIEANRSATDNATTAGNSQRDENDDLVSSRKGIYISGFPISEVFPLLFPPKPGDSREQEEQPSTVPVDLELNVSETMLNTSEGVFVDANDADIDKKEVRTNETSDKAVTVPPCEQTKGTPFLLNNVFASLFNSPYKTNRAKEEAPPAPSIDSQITFFFAPDLGTTSQFYENVLNFTLYRNDSSCRIYQIIPGACIGFTASKLIPSQKEGILTLISDDVDGWAERLTSLNVELE